MHDQRVLARHHLLAHHQLAARRQPPPAGAEGLVQDAPVLDLGQVDDAVGLDLDVLGVQRLHQHRGRLGAEGRRREAVEGRRPVDGRAGSAVGAVTVAAERGGEGLGGGAAARAGFWGGDLGGQGRVDVGDGGGLDDGGLRVDGPVDTAGGWEEVPR